MRRALPARPHCRRILAGTVAVVVAGCGAAGAPGYDTAGLARTIRKDLDKHPGFQVVSVSCPKQAKLAKGVVVHCSVKLRGGRVVRMKATQLDGKGTVHLVASEMLPDNVEHGIVVTLAQRGKQVRAVCPEHVTIVVGKTFNCTVISRERARRPPPSRSWTQTAASGCVSKRARLAPSVHWRRANAERSPADRPHQTLPLLNPSSPKQVRHLHTPPLPDTPPQSNLAEHHHPMDTSGRRAERLLSGV